jgi:hypothetical protein
MWNKNYFLLDLTQVYRIVLCVGLANMAQSLMAQQVLRQTIQLNWANEARVLTLPVDASGRVEQLNYPTFEGAAFDETAPTIPVLVKKIPINGNSSLEVVLTGARFEPINFDYAPANIGNNIEPVATVSYFRGRAQAHIRFAPLRRNVNTGRIERLVEGTLELRAQPIAEPLRPNRRNSTQSVLASGSIYKIAVSESGVHKIDFAFLQNLGIDVANIDPRTIQIFGNGGKPLPELSSAARIDDLLENQIFVQGEQDGRFDNSDFILFYAQGTKNWIYNNTSSSYTHQQNIYTDNCYYYIKVGQATGRRISTGVALSPTYTTTSYDALQHIESDEVNLFDQEQPALPPSGREWLGNAFKTRRNQSFAFSFSNRIINQAVRMRSRVVARAFTTSSFVFTQGSNPIQTSTTDAITSYVYGLYASPAIGSVTFTSPSNNITIDIAYNNPSSSAEGWLDYMSLQARCELVFTGGQMSFRDGQTIAHAASRFELRNASSNLQVWDVTDISDIHAPIATLSGSTLSFNAATSGILREFVAFDGSSFRVPTAVGSVANQNLHNITTAPQLVVVYHPLFKSAADQLVAHRISHSQMSAIAVDINHIFNEFSSGNPDVTAIRDFAKMLYDRATPTDSLRYLLILGAGSFDYKNLSSAGSGNHNFVPLFETDESLDPLRTYTTDDYFALLDDNEGNINADQDLDIAVGRISILTATQANQVIDKIIRYDTSPDAMSDWRNVVSFVADDEDNNLHFRDAEIVTNIVKNIAPDYNVSKIYLDAYQQQSTGGGGRYTDVNDAVLRRLFQGTLVMNYIGHGADDGWSQERVFTNTEINTLANDDKFPLFITATCSFSPHDDPSLTSAGELLLHNPRGGAIALLTTVRVVLADANAHLTRSTFDNLFIPLSSGRMPTVGEVLMLAKNRSGLLSASNSRKYVLLGDPSMTLAYPKYDVATTQINGNTPQIGLDTMRALQRVTISGEVRTPAGALASNFNGIVYPTVFDKVDTLLTRGNDRNSQIAPFPLQSKIIFRGRATVTNGQFTFTFIVPRDINYTFGNGRISYYAADIQTMIDAAGMYNGFIIGGTDPNAANDVVGPDVDVFMNDENFAFGAITDPNPTLLVKLYDENGINTVGNSIGHDLVAQIQLPIVTQTSTNANGETKTYNLNDSYQADIDQYQRGMVRYPLRNLADGKHTINVEAWDVYNNLGQGNTEFVVASSAEIALDHVLNYPNPFTTSTNFQFDHNILNKSLEIQVQIFTISGSLVKTINEIRFTEAYHIRDVHWDGLDEYGDRLGRGTYIYKISVRTADGAQVENSAYQKLVILR